MMKAGLLASGTMIYAATVARQLPIRRNSLFIPYDIQRDTGIMYEKERFECFNIQQSFV